MQRNNGTLTHEVPTTKRTKAETMSWSHKAKPTTMPLAAEYLPYTSCTCTFYAQSEHRFHKAVLLSRYSHLSIVPAIIIINQQAEAKKIKMGCTPSQPMRTMNNSQPLTIRITLTLRALLTKISSWLKSCIPSRPVKTYPTLSEPGPHIPVEETPLASDLCEDESDRYDLAYREMCLPKRERLRRQSAPEPLELGSANGNVPVGDGDDGEKIYLMGDPFLFL